MKCPNASKEGRQYPHPTKTLLRPVDVDETIIQKVQGQNRLYSIHTSADGLQTFNDLFHVTEIQTAETDDLDFASIIDGILKR